MSEYGYRSTLVPTTVALRPHISEIDIRAENFLTSSSLSEIPLNPYLILISFIDRITPMAVCRSSMIRQIKILITEHTPGLSYDSYHRIGISENFKIKGLSLMTSVNMSWNGLSWDR